ncbi:MAG: hypothetical protein R2771_07470 [Saprospiraceae bacterium]
MKQRLAIAATMIGDPRVVIFDEPTNGLDPNGIAEVRDILSRVADLKAVQLYCLLIFWTKLKRFALMLP